MASPDLDAPARVSHLTAAKCRSGSRRVCVCPRANSTKPGPSPDSRPEAKRCGSGSSGTRPQARPADQGQARLHRRRPEARAHSYPARSCRVGSAQKSAAGWSCRRRERPNRRPSRLAFRKFRQRSARRNRAAPAQRKRITTTSALRGISSSFRGRSRARLAQAADPALASFCDRGSSHASCACSASGRSAVRQAVPLRTAARFACASRNSAQSCSRTSCAPPRSPHPSRSWYTTTGARRSVTAKLR